MVGFDDILFASYVRPSLTTVAQLKAEMGRWAMEMALTMVKTEDPAAEEFSNLVLKGKLVVRESTTGTQDKHSAPSFSFPYQRESI